MSEVKAQATPNTEPIPATDAEIARLLSALREYPDDDSPTDSEIADTGITPRILIARIEQEREMRRELMGALKNLVTVNQDWNAAVEETIGRPPHWTDTYLDAARDILARAAKMEENYAK